jgi:hypothetical protein
MIVIIGLLLIEALKVKIFLDCLPLGLLLSPHLQLLGLELGWHT